MATGDQNDFVLRLKAVLPDGWFPAQSTTDTSPVLTAILSGPAWSLSWLYSLIAYAKNQTRIATGTDVWLDIMALDYFGTMLQRRPNETDTTYSQRIRDNLLAPKNTRSAIIKALTLLTGRAPEVFEPGNTGDTGGWGSGEALVWRGMAYNTAGGWGSLALPFQAFITAFRPLGNGVANVGGYYSTTAPVWGGGGYGVGAIEYVDSQIISDTVTDADIYATIANTQPAGTIMWTRIES